MRQAIHIFRKDARHCWPYVAAVLAFTAMSAWSMRLDTLDPTKPPAGGGFQFDPLVLVWWLAIGAAIHGESPVGDRQFWTARPYSWKSLLASKLLFFAAFLALPLLLSDCVQLIASGFNPVDLIPGLLWRQCWFFASLVPAFVAASLTRRTRELLLALVLTGVMLLIGLYASVLSAVHSHGVPHPEEPSWIGDAVLWLIPVAGVFLILWQYARRRTILIGAIAIAIFAFAPVWTALREVTWLRSASLHFSRPFDPRVWSADVRLAADAGIPSPISTAKQQEGLIGVSLTLNGWPLDMMSCHVRTASVWLTGPNEFGQWGTSVTDPASSLTPAGEGCAWIWVNVGDLARKVRPWTKADLTADLGVSLDLKLYEHKETIDLGTSSGWTRVPGFGNVKLAENVRGGLLVRRTALQPAQSGWAYRLGDTGPDLLTNADLPKFVDNELTYPGLFQPSPVHSYAGKCVIPARGPRPSVLIVRHLAATLSRQLSIRNVNLADYAAHSH
jgi:hypothetical protein